MDPKKNGGTGLFAEQEPAPEPEKTASAAPPEKKSPASLPQKPFVTNLSPRYTFDNFVVGNSNRFAKRAAMAVANNPAFATTPSSCSAIPDWARPI